jgi:ABC-type glutathione transport system ATPase component
MRQVRRLRRRGAAEKGANAAQEVSGYRSVHRKGRVKWQALNCSNVKKSFGSVDVIHGVDLTVDDGEFTVFVGPSGCGKSTLLRLVAGLEQATGGKLAIGARTSPMSSLPTGASPWCFSPTRSIRT